MCRSEHPLFADERAATYVMPAQSFNRTEEIMGPTFQDSDDVGVWSLRSIVAVNDSLVEMFRQTSGCQAEQ